MAFCNCTTDLHWCLGNGGLCYTIPYNPEEEGCVWGGGGGPGPHIFMPTCPPERAWVLGRLRDAGSGEPQTLYRLSQ